MLFRKIAWVETELSNELNSDYESIFMKHCQQRPPSGLWLPSVNIRPICLHLVDGDVMIFWASVKREYGKWLKAF